MTGCPVCTDADPARAAELSLRVPVAATMISESHLSASLSCCGACGQVYLRVFAELIDWEDGDDPQWWLVIPVTPEESQRLGSVTEDDLNDALRALPVRQYLWQRRGAGGPGTPGEEWLSHGLMVPPYS